MRTAELWTSRKGTLGGSAKESLACRILFDPGDDPNNTPAMLQYALTKFPLITTLGNVFDTVDWDPIEGNVGFVVTCNYKSVPQTRQTNSASFSFNTGGGTQHISHSIRTVASYGAHAVGTVPTGTTTATTISTATSTPPNFNKGINVTSEGPQGLDILVRSFDFKTTFYVAPADMTDSYVDTLYNATGGVNADQVTVSVDGINITFDSGELLMAGAEGQKRIGFGDWALAVSWSALPNQSGITIGPISGIVKNGHDYLWVYSVPQLDEASMTLPPTPAGAYVEQIYKYVPLTPILRSTAFGPTNSQPWLSPPTSSGGGGFGES